MPDLDFKIEGAEPQLYSAAPIVNFKLKITQTGSPAVPIHTVALRCQVRIDSTRRRYIASEQEALLELFGRPEQWQKSLRAMLWTHVSAMVPAFEQSIVTDLPVPCTMDFNVAAAKYFNALEDGLAPLSFLFNGTYFYQDPHGALQVALIPWEKEAAFNLPVAIWKEVMDHHFPNAAWLTLQKDVFDRLYQYRRDKHFPTWEGAIDALLSAAATEVSR
jgi:hypothetical protein